MGQQIPDVELGRAQSGVVEVDEADLVAEQHLLVGEIAVDDVSCNHSSSATEESAATTEEAIGIGACSARERRD